MIDLDAPPRASSSTHTNRPDKPRTIIRCTAGHTYFGIERSKSLCPFCEQFLQEFRDLGSARNCHLLSKVQGRFLEYLCKKHNTPFSVSVGNARRGIRCPTCSEGSIRERSPRPRDILKRVVNPVDEQAHLLNAARSRYNAQRNKDAKVTLEELYEEAKTAQIFDCTLKQSVVVLAASQPTTGDTYWKLVSLSVGVDDTTKLSLDQVYRTAARQVHPDKSKHPRADEAFKKLATEFSLVKMK